MEIKRGNYKKSQITIFVILAIAILIVLILLFIGKEKIADYFTGEPPIEQIKRCAREATTESIDILTVQGGSLNPSLYYLYQGNKIEYLCYTNENYKTCVVQKPFLKKSIEKEIKTYIEPKIKNCIKNAEAFLEKQGFEVTSKTPVVSVELVPSNILINIDSNLKIAKDRTSAYKEIKTDVSSKLYDFAMIVSSIINWEARYGDSETLNYMLYYPSLKVEKKLQSDGTTIYILTDRITLDKFIFASRSIAWPPGFGFDKIHQLNQ